MGSSLTTRVKDLGSLLVETAMVVEMVAADLVISTKIGEVTTADASKATTDAPLTMIEEAVTTHPDNMITTDLSLRKTIEESLCMHPS